MVPLDPLTPDHIKRHAGQVVLIVLKDGTEQIGVLSRWDKKRIIINEQPKAEGNLSRRPNNKKPKSIKNKQAKSDDRIMNSPFVDPWLAAAPNTESGRDIDFFGRGPVFPADYGVKTVFNVSNIAAIYLL